MLSVLKNHIKPAETTLIRNMRFDELVQAAKWTNVDYWNMCEYDFDVLHASYPEMMFVCDLNGEMISTLVCVRYGGYVYSTMILTKPEMRSSGIAKKLMVFGDNSLSAPGIESTCIDCEDHMLAIFGKFGYKPFCSINRYGKTAKGQMNKNLFDLKTVPFEMVAKYDTEVFGYDRSSYIKGLMSKKHCFALGMIKDGRLVGYGLVRKATIGWLVMPLFADTKEVAMTIMEGLQSLIQGEKIFVEVLGANPQAIQIVEQGGWDIEWKQTRIVKQGIPKHDFARTYGVSDFS